MNIERNKGIEETLNSLEGCKRATAPDYFYTRLRARMLARHEGGERELTKKSNRNWVLRPVYIVAALFIVLAVNVFVLLKGQEDDITTTTADNDMTVQQSIAAEYRLNDNNTVYDLNQDK